MKGLAIKGSPLMRAGSRVGIVNDLLFDWDEAYVVALLFTVAGTEGDFVLTIDDVDGVHSDAVEVHPHASPIPLTDTPRHRDLPSLNWVIGQTVQTETGQVVGTVSDLEIDPRTWKVQAFEVVHDFAQAFHEGPHTVPLSDVLRPGEQSITIREDALKETENAQQSGK